jgi:hypothetical protein
MSSQPVEHLHPVVEFAERLTIRLEKLADQPLLSMTPAEKRTALATLARGEAQLAHLKLRLLEEAEHSEATLEAGAASAADWLAVQARQVRRDARSDLRLALALEDHGVLSAAMAHGQVNTAQARAILTALARLPHTGAHAVSAEQRVAAEAHLVELAADHDAARLAVLGRHLFEVIEPDLAEEFEGRALEQEEERASRHTRFTMWQDDQGTCHGRFRIPARHGQMLEKMILALTSPTRPGQDLIDPDLPTPTRHGIALTQLVEAIPADWLPTAGGCGATVVVTMTLEQLLADLDKAGVCTLDTGGHISAPEARRLACAAGIIPMVLGAKSQVLDLGRKRRLHTEAQRITLGVRDGGCTAEHCETPPGRCHAHHDHPWSAGGDTSLDNGRLLCPHHHRKIHDPHYQTTRLPNGKIRFHQRE